MEYDVPSYLVDVCADGELDLQMYGRVQPETIRRLHETIAEQRRQERAAGAGAEGASMLYQALFGPKL